MRRGWYYLPTLIVAVAIAILSLIEYPHIETVEKLGDKFWHTMMYVGLAGVMMCGLLLEKKQRRWYPLIAWGISSAYGGVMELLQAWCTVSRTGDWYDFYADMIGAAVGVGLAYLFIWACKKTGFIK